MNMIKDITSFIFIEDKPEKVDIIFIPGGSWPEPSEKAAYLWHEGYAPYILPSGKYSLVRGFFPGPEAGVEIYNGVYKTEWEFMAEVLKINGVNSNSILCEAKAEFTYKNAFNSRVITDNEGLTIRKAIICCKTFHSRRCLMYYSWAYPETEFFVCPIETQNINKNNWFQTSEGIELVMGELARCGTQLKEAIPFFNTSNSRHILS